MAKISAKFGPIHGNDGNTAYRTIKGRTFQNYIDTEAPKRERTQKQRNYAALLKLMNIYANNHYADLVAFFPKGNKRSSRHAFLAYNKGELAAALFPLAERYANGEKISDTQIENAVSTYAASNPRSIVIGIKKGYQTVYLSGAWPSKFRFFLFDLASTPVEYQQTNGTFADHEGNAANDGDTGDSGGDTSGDTTQGGSEQVTLTVAASPSNGGTVTGGGTVAKGSSVTLNATANSGYTFSRWSDGVTTAQRSVTASASATYTAEFTANAPSGGNSDD